MKKEDISGLIVYLLIFGLTVVFTFLVIREYYPKSQLEIYQYILFVLGAFISGLVFNSILFEVAHIIGAKMGGYEVICVSILGLTFFKKDGKRKIKFTKFDGLTGETKIIPIQDRKKPYKPRLYCLLGSIFFTIEIIAIVFTFSFLQSDVIDNVMLKNLGYFLLIMGVVGAAILLYNILPLKLDSLTDGYRLVLLSNKKNRNAFNDLLMLESGMNIKTTENKEEEKTVAFSSDIKLNQVYLALKDEDMEQANSILDSILDNVDDKITNKNLLISKELKLYLLLISKPEEEVRPYYEDKISFQDRKAIGDDSSLCGITSYILIAGILDKSRHEVERVLNKTYKAYKRLQENRKELEVKLYNSAIKYLDSLKPTWNLKDFLINL